MTHYHDELWELVEQDRGLAPAHLAAFVRGLEEADHALDLGGGDGRLASELSARELTLADPSQVALERAGERLPDRRLVLIDPDATLPFADAEFDLVLCGHVLEHARDLQLLLSEVRRVLRPGGTLAIATRANGRLAGLDVLVRGFERRFPPLGSRLRFLTRRSLERLLRELGFELESLHRRRGDLLAVARR